MFQTSPLLDIFLYLHSAFQDDDNRIVFHNSDILNKATNSHIVIFRKIKTPFLNQITVIYKNTVLEFHKSDVESA